MVELICPDGSKVDDRGLGVPSEVLIGAFCGTCQRLANGVLDEQLMLHIEQLFALAWIFPSGVESK